MPAGTKIAGGTEIPAYSELGYGCTLGNHCTLSNHCTLGDCCTLGNNCKLGAYCKLEGITCKRFMNLSNVDGSGRQLLIITDGKKVLVRAGCFLGNPEEFCARAEKGNKPVYADMVRAVAAILLKHAKKTRK